ncbi:MAG: 23S rRNA (guanosine(2251)-2'-O)-methyltransferase RlmB [Oscillospiraceae bacterium]|nr:23S rRNA (guanosine(2251)-2'-O)-methyltransferase RlmB [Oscillospiraceae bacterium]
MDKKNRVFKPEKEIASESSYIVGRNAVLEALRSGRELDFVTIQKGELHGSINEILSLCRKNNVVIKEAEAGKLSELSGKMAHQGVIAQPSAVTYSSVEDILKIAEDRGEAPFIVIADQIEDPHNLGAIIRTAEACGVHGVIIPKRRSVGANATVYKTSAGALSHMAVARVTNLTETIKELKKNGVWIYGADAKGESYCNMKFDGPAALVIGSEGRGISELVLKQCDFLVSLFMRGKINSLNASVAGGILMYEIARSRL